MSGDIIWGNNLRERNFSIFFSNLEKIGNVDDQFWRTWQNWFLRVYGNNTRNFFWKICTFCHFQTLTKNFLAFLWKCFAALSEMLYTCPEDNSDIEKLIRRVHIYWKILKLGTKTPRPSDKKLPEVLPKLFFPFPQDLF